MLSSSIANWASSFASDCRKIRRFASSCSATSMARKCAILSRAMLSIGYASIREVPRSPGKILRLFRFNVYRLVRCRTKDLYGAVLTLIFRLMSALGQKQTSDYRLLMSALPPKADIAERQFDVRFVPKADIGRLIRSPHRRVRATSLAHRCRALLPFAD
jgi:hypothetical protein